MDVEPNWRKCERAWGSFMSSQGYAVTALNEAVGNNSKTKAPLVSINGANYRAPDFQTNSAGKSEYWEVKYRSQMDVDPLTGENEFWTEYEVFRDYAELSEVSQTRVWVVVFCKNYDRGAGQWLRATANTIKVNGRKKSKVGVDGQQVDAWVWPVSSMQLVAGPDESFLGPNLSKDTDSSTDPGQGQRLSSADVNAYRAELEKLCLAIGIEQIPQYSVLAICPDDSQISELVKLPNYGIRVFIFGHGVTGYINQRPDLMKFCDSRLLEFGDCSKELEAIHIIDGVGFSLMSEEVKGALVDADRSNIGGFNLFQYQIVHSGTESDVLVTAGAGTGKTETMSERIMFLLSTFRGINRNSELVESPVFLNPKDVALITFTKEAAKEMRNRIGRVLVLRQRLCPMPIHPVTAWLMQVAQMEVSTIHSFAKKVLKDSGAVAGLSPDFKVSRGTLQFRLDFNKATSPLIGDAYAQDPNLPALHEIQSFVEKLWQKIENHGFDLIGLASAEDSIQNLRWSSVHKSLSEGDRRVAKLIEHAMLQLAKLQRESAKSNQTLTTNQLVPTALQTVKLLDPTAGNRYKYLFVDEFQDTDSSQIEILIEIKKVFGSRLFVVGDNKQGIYKFRGARGNALAQLAISLKDSNFSAPEKYGLVKNFRTGNNLLNQLNPIFSVLGKAKLLDFGVKDYLRSGLPKTPDESEFRSVYFSDEEGRQKLCLQEVMAFKAKTPGGTLAILTRENNQAIDLQAYLRKHNQPCLLVVGGGFYQSEAVRQLHAFLTAVHEPTNYGLVVQALETRWASGLCREFPMQDSMLKSDSWLTSVKGLMPWQTRLANQASGKPSWDDLDKVKARLVDLGEASREMSFLDWLVKCLEVFKPERTSLGPRDDYPTRLQYEKNLEHLLTQIDLSFVNAPVSLLQVRDWLSLKIATDKSMDEPMLDQEDVAGIPVAITVHKSKGLEFDCVLLPFPEKPFKNNKYLSNVQTLVRGQTGEDQVIWKWKVGGVSYTNVSDEDQQLWADDHNEVIKEEARLLYVALTRAANKLVIFEKTDANHRQPSWLYFIDSGRN